MLCRILLAAGVCAEMLLEVASFIQVEQKLFCIFLFFPQVPDLGMQLDKMLWVESDEEDLEMGRTTPFSAVVLLCVTAPQPSTSFLSVK